MIAALLQVSLAFAVHAEGGCPPGQYPQAGAGWKSCVPIPNYDQAQQSPGQAGPVWEDRWQAIATDADKGVLGKATNVLSQKIAESDAIDDCKSKGGIKCEVQAFTRNGCIAMALGTDFMNFKIGKTKLEADDAAKNACDQQDSKCAIFYSACSMAVRVM